MHVRIVRLQARSALEALDRPNALALPLIEPTPAGDPQPNPAPGDPAVMVYARALSPDEETETIVKSLARWLPANPDQTVAVLAPENQRGFKLTEALERASLPFDDSLLRSDSATRAAAQALSTVLSYITQPHTATHLGQIWEEVWWPRWFAQNAARRKMQPMAGHSRKRQPGR
ncbi:MAG: hypothetical protein HC802_23295 [Caldilineaceae bacterium]|nr:hypothetical protein [Caldilineaceae bacterium]